MNAPPAEFLEIFRDEAGERLDRIVETLLAVEAGSAAPDAVDSLFRDTHTIKGSAGMVGMVEIGALAHVMEDLLAGARSDGALPAALVEPLLRGADAVRRHLAGDAAPAFEFVADLAAAEQTGREAAPALAEAAPSTAPAAPAPASAPEAAPSPLPAAAGAARNERRSIRVPAEKIDRLLDLVGETVLHRRRLEHELGEHAASGGERLLSDELDIGDHLLGELKGAAVGMRTLPLSSIMAPLPRAVRDLAAEIGKEVELVIEGAETELDRAILEGLPEQLVHLLRNSIGHGIEPPQERERVGKPARGRLVLRAEQRGGVVEVTIADDGRGVSEETLVEARKTGSLTEVLTRAGFSTADQVSAISGRGVGLDAVKEQVEAWKGSLEVHSVPGAGTKVVLRLPLALALLEVLLVERAGVVYGFPLASVEEVLSLRDTLSLGGRQELELRGRSVLLADLSVLLGAAAGPPEPHAPVVVLKAASGKRIATICDALLGQEEVVVKSLGTLLSSLSTYLGAAILGDGRIALLVDPAILMHAELPAPSAPRIAPAVEQSPPAVLIVEDSLTIRELQRSILEAAGYRVRTAPHGRDALALLDRDAEIDLVVTDVEMPEMGGLELTETIRGHASLSTLPIVIVTSLGDDDDRRRGIEAGADAYIVKRAFDQHDLLETVERLIGR